MLMRFRLGIHSMLDETIRLSSQLAKEVPLSMQQEILATAKDTRKDILIKKASNHNIT